MDCSGCCRSFSGWYSPWLAFASHFSTPKPCFSNPLPYSARTFTPKTALRAGGGDTPPALTDAFVRFSFFKRPRRAGARRVISRALQNGHRRRIILCVTQTDEDRASAAGKQQLLTVLVQDHVWLAALLACDFHVVPAKLRADSGSEGLGNG